jgi:hypothetical protein
MEIFLKSELRVRNKQVVPIWESVLIKSKISCQKRRTVSRVVNQISLDADKFCMSTLPLKPLEAETGEKIENILNNIFLLLLSVKLFCNMKQF